MAAKVSKGGTLLGHDEPHNHDQNTLLMARETFAPNLFPHVSALALFRRIQISLFPSKHRVTLCTSFIDPVVEALK